jgi:hypothetical protein
VQGEVLFNDVFDQLGMEASADFAFNSTRKENTGTSHVRHEFGCMGNSVAPRWSAAAVAVCDYACVHMLIGLSAPHLSSIVLHIQ